MSKETKTQTEKLPEEALDKVTGGGKDQMVVQDSLLVTNPKIKLDLNNPPLVNPLTKP